jgi:hypothetical protein
MALVGFKAKNHPHKRDTRDPQSTLTIVHCLKTTSKN